VGFSQEQVRNARIIIGVGREMGMSTRDIHIGLMTAMQESTLRNLRHGDRDSQGLFQQRPSQGWGTVQQVTDPRYASKKFFNALKGVDNRDSMRMTEAAQAVQRSAFPEAYAKWKDPTAKLLGKYKNTGNVSAPTTFYGPNAQGMEDANAAALQDMQTQSQIVGQIEDMEEAQKRARSVASPTALGIEAADAPMEFDDIDPTFPTFDTEQLNSLKQQVQSLGKNQYDVDPAMFTGPGGIPDAAASGAAGNIINRARKALGTPYVWGGTQLGKGMDCSGFVQWAFKGHKDLPRISADQARAGKRISLKNLRPGDLVAWDNSSRNGGADHIAIYIGKGRVIHAPRPGKSVEIAKMFDAGNAWGVRL